jgi:hypothetical protein
LIFILLNRANQRLKKLNDGLFAFACRSCYTILTEGASGIVLKENKL